MVEACERAGVILGDRTTTCPAPASTGRSGASSPTARSGESWPSVSSTPSCCRSGSRAGGSAARPAAASPWTSPATTRRSSTRSLGALPADVVALATQQGPWEAAAEDAIMATMRYADGTLVQTHDAFTVAYAPTGLHVMGSDGAIFATDVMTQEPDRHRRLRDASGRTGDRGLGPARPVRDQRRRVRRRRARRVRPAGRDRPGRAREPSQVALAVRQAAESGRARRPVARRPDRARPRQFGTVPASEPRSEHDRADGPRGGPPIPRSDQHRARDPAVLRALRREEPHLELRQALPPVLRADLLPRRQGEHRCRRSNRWTSSGSTS